MDKKTLTNHIKQVDKIEKEIKREKLELIYTDPLTKGNVTRLSKMLKVSKSQIIRSSLIEFNKYFVSKNTLDLLIYFTSSPSKINTTYFSLKLHKELDIEVSKMAQNLKISRQRFINLAVNLFITKHHHLLQKN